MDQYFDSNCMTCSEEFKPSREPPIRTLSIQGIQSGDTNPDPANISFHLHNRHLQCIIEHQIQFFPVSQAWHESVALARLSKLSNDGAENLVFRLPMTFSSQLWVFTASALNYGIIT